MMVISASCQGLDHVLWNLPEWSDETGLIAPMYACPLRSLYLESMTPLGNRKRLHVRNL